MLVPLAATFHACTYFSPDVESKTVNSPSQLEANGNRFFSVARIGVLLLMLSIVVLWTASLPAYYHRVTTLTVPTYSQAGEVVASNALVQQEAAARGLSLSATALYRIFRDGFQVAVWLGVAVLILWRARSQWFGWFTALVLACVGANGLTTVLQVTQPFPAVLLGLDLVTWLAWPALFVWIYFFPGRRPAPSWTLWPVSILCAFFFLMTAAGVLAAWEMLPAAFYHLQPQIGPPLLLPTLAIILYSQVYRYRHSYSNIERQQVKWFVFSLVVLLATVLLVVFVDLIGVERPLLVDDLMGLAILVVPISIGLAVLRYRLFDVDLLIRKTLAYSLLSATLILVYFGSVALLSSLSSAVSGRSSAVVTVLSTLTIAAIFSPLRRRIQNAIDHRFYRRKYDAAQVLAAFAVTARDETDLDRLTAELARVVQTTMQPDRVAVWLKPTTDDRPLTTGKQPSST